MEYEDRVVIFLDVLGFSNFTNYTGSTQINQSKKIEKVNNYLEMLHKYFNSKNAIAKSRMVTSFSDSIVVSIKVEDIDDFDIEVLEIYYLLINSIIHYYLIHYFFNLRSDILPPLLLIHIFAMSIFTLFCSFLEDGGILA